MSLEVELYFVALWKHDAPQFVVAGPYLDWSDAHDEAVKRSEPVGAYSHVVLKTAPLSLEVCE